MITYQIESYDEILDEINEIISDHYIETELYSTQIPLDPDYNMYSAGNEAGIIQFYTARDDLNLIGYVIVMLANKPHAKNCLYALCDMVYVHPEYRHTGVAPELLQYAEQEVKNLGAEVFALSMKIHLPFKTLMKALNYDEAEVVYTKYLKD